MAQEIIVDYKAEIDKITRDLEKFIDANEKLAKDQNKVQSELDQTTKAVDKLEKEFATAGKSTKTVNDNIKTFSKTAKTELSGLGNQVKSIGAGIAAGIAAAFSVQAVIAFGRASINAFLEAQENAEKLRFTITQVGGESEAAFQRLIDQSEQLQNITIFSDDSIQQAQNALATFGLTADQIEELLPKLADFASATKVDIVQAAQQVGAGLQGAGREFRKFGIDVSAVATPMENLSAITEGFARFQGSAAKETETLTGQLKQQANAADDLQETIGEKLAPAFVRFKLAAFDAINTIIDSFKDLDEFRKESAANFEDSLAARIEAELIGRNEINNLGLLKNAQNELLQTEKELLANREQIRTLDVNDKRLVTVSQQNDELTKTLNILNDIIAREEKRAADLERTLTAEQLRTKQTQELNTLLKENEAINNGVAQSNIQLINLEIAARKKQSEELQKELAKQLEDLKKFNGDVKKIPPLELEVAFKEPDLTPVNDITSEDLALPPPSDVAFYDGLDRTLQNVVKKWLDANEQVLDASFNLFSQLVSLQNQFANQRIDKINDEKETQLESLDAQTRAIDENLDRRRISEKEAEDQRKKLLADRVAAEDAADKKIRAIKRRQAIINKIAAIAEIAIETAKNVAAGPVPLIPFWIALGAAQSAIVAAQPIPYKKGTKSAKGGLSLVDEEGTEAIYRGRLTTLEKGDKVLTASKTRTYGDALDAMIDNRFDSWVMDKYLAPRLEAQNKVYKSSEQKSFARNLAESVFVNVASPQGRKLESVNLNNVDEFADAIAERLRQSPYRR